MLPLTGPDFPTSHADLARSLEAGLSGLGAKPREIRCEGGVFPKIGHLEVDLSGAKLDRGRDFGSAAGTGPEVARMEVDRLNLKADPLEFEGTPVRVELWAEQAVLSGLPSKGGAFVLEARTSARGEVRLEARHADLEVLAHTLVSAAAAAQGIEIKKTRLELVSTGPRSLRFVAEVSAKMFIMSATVAVSGALLIDESLNARLSELSCKGEGMIASAANAFLKPHFAKLESRPIALTAFSLGGLELRDVTLETGESVRLLGVFGR